MGNAKIVNLDQLVFDNIRTLSLPSKRFARPIAIILVGGPFSGKTTLVSFLAKRFPLAVLSEANMAAFLAPRATFFKRGAEEIFLLASKTIDELIRQKVSVIYDASVRKHSEREMIRKLVAGAGGKFLLIHLTMPENEAYARLRKINAQIVRGDRKGFIMDRVLFRYELNSIESPTVEESPVMYNDHAVEAAEKVEDHVRSLLEE